jgi:predicted amidohydrolase
MTTRLRVACVQMTSGAHIGRNIDCSVQLIRQAHGDGAQFVALPEVVNLCEKRSGRAAKKVYLEAAEPALRAYRDLAAELGIWILAGSLVVKLSDDDRFANRSFLIDATGAIVAAYDKIHMFDVDLEGGESYRESRRFRPGTQAVLAPSPWGPIGMTICYDMRFAYLYRMLAQAGARILTAP